MPKPSLRTRLIRYAEAQAPQMGVHPSVVPGVVDRALELHSTARERANIDILEGCVRDHLEATPTLCILTTVLRWSGREEAWDDPKVIILEELASRDFTRIDVESRERSVRCTVRSILAPPEAKKEFAEAIRAVIGNGSDGRPTWLLFEDEVRCKILDTVQPELAGIPA